MQSRVLKSSYTKKNIQQNSLFSVCKNPIYIEAREISSKKDWTGSDSILIHQVKDTEKWAFGLSKDYG